jgi:hypothetical protein
MDFCVFFLSRCFVCFCDYQDPGQTKNLPGKILRLFRSQGRVIPNSAFWCQYLFLKLFFVEGESNGIQKIAVTAVAHLPLAFWSAAALRRFEWSSLRDDGREVVPDAHHIGLKSVNRSHHCG